MRRARLGYNPYMEMEVVYYTCLNNDCERHRNVFVDGDPLHENCERRRLYLEGQEKAPGMPAWAWLALPAVLGLGAAAFMLYRRMTAGKSMPPRPTLREDHPRETWSGQHSHAEERKGHAVPPPIA